MRIVAITACPTGIAHTYMAAAELKKASVKIGVQISIETQGAMGIENTLRSQDIARADLVLIASDIEIKNAARFTNNNVHYVSIEDVLTDPINVLSRCKLAGTHFLKQPVEK